MTLRRASAQRRSWRSSSSSRSSSVRALSGGLVGEAEAVGRVTMGEVHRGPGLDPQALDHPSRVLGHSVTLVRRRARQLDPHRRSRARHCWTGGPSRRARRRWPARSRGRGRHHRAWRERDTSAREKRSKARAATAPRSCPGRRRAPRRRRARRRCGPAPTPPCRRACARARCPTRLPSTCRSRSSSPSTLTPSVTSAVTTRSGATARASAAASTPARRGRPVHAPSGRPSSSRASSSRSSTSDAIRTDSCSVRRIAWSRSAASSRPPWR